MLVIPGRKAKDVCDRHLGPTRRDLLRVGGSAFLGLTLGQTLQMQSASAASESSGAGWGRAKSVIMVYLQGGPSHIDLWDPKENVPEKVKSAFGTIHSKVPGIDLTENLPKLAQVTDKLSLIRSMSYSPNGLFNHTAAIYQMHTGYTADKVSPSGQLEPPSPKDYPNFGSNIIKLKPPEVPMLPFVMMPRPLQESNVVNKSGTAGFLGRAYDPYYLFPPGDDMDMQKMERINITDLTLRPEVSTNRLGRRAKLRELINAGMPGLDQAVEKYDMDKYYETAMNLISSGRARDAFDLSKETDKTRDMYGRNTFGQSLLLARRLVDAGTRVVEVIWPKVANSDNHSWDHHVGLTDRMKNKSGPMLDAGLSSLIADMDDRGMLDETLIVAVGEFGRSPQRGVSTSGNGNSADGRDHWPYCYTACLAGAGIKRGAVYGESDQTASAPLKDPVHPTELLATIYHTLGIDPATIVYNHLNQPRELVKAEAVTGLFG
ncbi:DUF1501 domain-containing protein [Blastopirellula sp. JC732]|uniref:DUF1501 domain-containing protein n=1 Tax=Blastopirellula sediminis TaxID=2894196 RepID=A0A9X1SKN4_9BACT|nr:DUF1501 domain-containing protein [Blastopirellula sediminis]MCC9606734.1 DUF1501 domain-containing protein [Blastopirellula sediminis]MCC9629969.1 DUF1501 domain-containing protein [Blastopirellula sediminis]